MINDNSQISFSWPSTSTDFAPTPTQARVIATLQPILDPTPVLYPHARPNYLDIYVENVVVAWQINHDTWAFPESDWSVFKATRRLLNNAHIKHCTLHLSDSPTVLGPHPNLNLNLLWQIFLNQKHSTLNHFTIRNLRNQIRSVKCLLPTQPNLPADLQTLLVHWAKIIETQLHWYLKLAELNRHSATQRLTTATLGRLHSLANFVSKTRNLDLTLLSKKQSTYPSRTLCTKQHRRLPPKPTPQLAAVIPRLNQCAQKQPGKHFMSGKSNALPTLHLFRDSLGHFLASSSHTPVFRELNTTTWYCPNHASEHMSDFGYYCYYSRTRDRQAEAISNAGFRIICAYHQPTCPKLWNAPDRTNFILRLLWTLLSHPETDKYTNNNAADILHVLKMLSATRVPATLKTLLFHWTKHHEAQLRFRRTLLPKESHDDPKEARTTIKLIQHLNEQFHIDILPDPQTLATSL